MKFKLRVILFLATIFSNHYLFALTTRDDNKISKDEFKTSIKECLSRKFEKLLAVMEKK